MTKELLKMTKEELGKEMLMMFDIFTQSSVICSEEEADYERLAMTENSGYAGKVSAIYADYHSRMGYAGLRAAQELKELMEKIETEEEK